MKVRFFKFIPLFFLFVFKTALSCDYYFAQSDLCADLTWPNGKPKFNQLNSFSLHFFSKSNPESEVNLPIDHLQVYSWMIMDNGMDHQGPKITWTVDNKNQVTSHDARFFMMGMSGYWELKVQIGEDIQALRIDFDE